MTFIFQCRLKLPAIMLFIKKQCSLLIIVVFFRVSDAVCRQSFVTICETFEDFKNHEDADNLEDVMIGSEYGVTKMTSLNLMRTLELNKYHKLRTFMVVHAVNEITKTGVYYECNYYNNHQLQNVIFYGNIIKAINLDHFPNISPLKKLSLVNNQIESIEWAFTNHQIENLDLSDNLIELIDNTALPSNYPYMNSIKIRNNKISYIETDSFPLSLQSLNLDKNKLRYLEDGVLGNLIYLKELVLSHNYFKKIPKVNHLTQLIVFDISSNLLSKIETKMFDKMDNLKLLDVSNNKLFEPSILNILTTPNKQATLIISLALNSFKKLDLKNIDLQQQTLALYGNPWDCDKFLGLKGKLTGHGSDCDSKFLALESVPYCLNYNLPANESGIYYRAGTFDVHIEKFHNIFKKNKEKARCSLAPDRNQWINYIQTSCLDRAHNTRE